jgi:hypothetical protein
MRDMTNLIEVNTGTLGGSVFYGTIRINGNRVNVSNHLELGPKYKFRMIGKARAGFPMIVETETTLAGLPYYLSKNTTYVECFKESSVGGKGMWLSVLTTKGGKWNSIDKGLLEVLTVGDMHGAFPKMVDWNIWKAMNTKFHSCKSFVYNTPKAA